MFTARVRHRHNGVQVMEMYVRLSRCIPIQSSIEVTKSEDRTGYVHLQKSTLVILELLGTRGYVCVLSLLPPCIKE